MLEEVTRQPKDVAANIQRLAEIGLEVHITEMDVKIEEPFTDAKLARQAEVYRNMFEICMAAENCTAFVCGVLQTGNLRYPTAFRGMVSPIFFMNYTI